jgi:hypothetical protein
MTMGSVETAEREQQRAELAALLESKEFIRAPKLARLLSYLCEKYFAGEANQIKEYSIALEVFQRRESFDQDSDSIVRVEANRLRKRLAEGKAHPTHCTSQYLSDNTCLVSRPACAPPTLEAFFRLPLCRKLEKTRIHLQRLPRSRKAARRRFAGGSLEASA